MQIVMLNVIPQTQKTEFILFLQSLQRLLFGLLLVSEVVFTANILAFSCTVTAAVTSLNDCCNYSVPSDVLIHVVQYVTNKFLKDLFVRHILFQCLSRALPLP